MHHAVRILSAATVLALLAGCSSPEYLISTNTGVMITAHGKPKLDEKTGLYTYQDQDGRTATIRKDEVKQVMER